jgi:hypothetical protein
MSQSLLSNKFNLYRDSEELPALRRAFARLGDGTYNPPVTYVAGLCTI